MAESTHWVILFTLIRGQQSQKGEERTTSKTQVINDLQNSPKIGAPRITCKRAKEEVSKKFSDGWFSFNLGMVHKGRILKKRILLQEERGAVLQRGNRQLLQPFHSEGTRSPYR